MLSVSSDLLQQWIVGLLWPLTRILAVIAVAPVLNHRAIPNTVKLGLGLMLALIVAPTLPPLPKAEVFSWAGLMILFQQALIGVSIGFCLRIIFAAVDMAGQVIGMTMGLGFASFFDPQSEGQSTAITQFLGLLAMLVFLSINGHLLLITALAESFQTMPIGTGLHAADGYRMVQWGGNMFSAGLSIALPVVVALLLTNMALGILTRTAPQLNLFGIGFPITITTGFLIITLSLPSIAQPLQRLMEQGLGMVQQLGTAAVALTGAPI